MKRVIMHWSAGAHTPSDLDKEHYHKIIDGAGKVHDGRFPIKANKGPIKGKYAAHTLKCNTDSIGVAVAAMAGAQERPFVAGAHPITPAQVTALVRLCRELAAEYGIPVTRQTILSHAEVQPTLGIQQRGKWDIAWLPGMDKPGDPVKVGDHLRGVAVHLVIEHAHEGGRGDEDGAAELVATSALVEFLRQHLGEGAGGILFGRGGGFAGAVSAAGLEQARAVGDEIGVLHAALRMDQFLDELQSLVRSQVGVQTGQAGVGDQNPGNSHESLSIELQNAVDGFLTVDAIRPAFKVTLRKCVGPLNLC